MYEFMKTAVVLGNVRYRGSGRGVKMTSLGYADHVLLSHRTLISVSHGRAIQ